MHLSYLDLFLSFLGLTFGLPSALPGLFFQGKVAPHQGQAEPFLANLRAAFRSLQKTP